MRLTVVTGGANSGKTRFLHEAVACAVAAGERPTVVVPTLPDAVRAETEFADKGIVGVRLSAFDRFLDEMWLLHGDGRTILTNLARRVLMARAIESTGLTHCVEVAGEPGFRRMLCEVVRGLERERMHEAERLGGGDREIAHILARYAGVCEEHGMIEPLWAAAALADAPPVLEGPVVANRFTALSRVQEVLLTGLALQNQVTVALTWEHGHPVTEATQLLVTRLLDGGARHIVADEGPRTEHELASIERGLYRPGARVEATGSVSVTSASDELAEAELVGEIVRSWIADGVQPDRIAVVYRDPARRHHALHTLVERAGTDVHLDILIPFARSAYGAAFLALLDGVSAAVADRRRLLAYLATPYSGCVLSRVADADMTWRRERVEGPALLKALVELGGSAARAVALARRLARVPVTPETAPDWQELADLLLASAQDDHPPGTEEALLDMAVHSAVCEAVTSVLGLRRLGVTAAEVIEAIRDARVGPLPAPSSKAVIVTEAERLQGRRFDAVAIAGLSRSEFSPVKTSSAAQLLAERLGSLARMSGPLEERLLFYTVLTRARTRLAIVHPSSLSGNDHDIRSPFVDEILDLYRTEGERRSGMPPQGGPAAFCALTRDPESALGPEALRSPCAPRVRGSAPDTATERLTADLIRAQAEREELSVSEIETYLACPLRWLVTYGVRTREADSQLGVAELGSLAHRLLAGFYKEWHTRGRRRVTPDTAEEALALLDKMEAFAGAGASAPPRNLEERFAVAAVRERARALILDDATFLPGFEPLEHEFAFGVSSGRSFAFGGVRLAGSIDRIEASAGALVVTDYKSGSAIVGHRRFADDGLVQLPVYAAAAASILGRPAVGAVYRSIASLQLRGAWVADRADLGSRGVSTDSVDIAAFSALIGDAEVRVASAVRGMREGRIEPAPCGDRACRYCPISDVCREAVASWEPD